MPKKKTVRKKRTTVKKDQAVSEAFHEQMQDGSLIDPWPYRPFQQRAQDEFDRGKHRQFHVWHRRAGKDIFGLSLARRQMQKRVGTYVHCFPKQIQAKRSIWNGIDPRLGKRFIDVAFGDMEADRNNGDLYIEMMNGSMWQMLGSDNYNRLVGGNIVGVIFSEWALCDPDAWNYIRPMLLENKGWAVFITTYRGRQNHAYKMMQKLRDNPEWYCTELDVTKTSDVDGNRILTDEDIQKERESDMSEAMIQQEYFCNPAAVLDGAIYGQEATRLNNDTSRHNAIYDPSRPVHCVWSLDLPVHATAVLIQPGDRPTILRAQMDDWTTLPDALATMSKNPFPIQKHILHGAQADYAEHFRGLGITPKVLWNTNNTNEYFRASSLIQRCSIDMDKSGIMLDALGGYMRRERFDSQVSDKTFSDDIVYSWHHRIPQCLETFAVYDYNSGGGRRRRKPDYTLFDKAARISND